MSHIFIEQTIFVDHPSGNKTYGFRMYDDFAKWYYNQMTEDEFNKINERGILLLAYSLGDGEDMFDHAERNDMSICVNDIPFTKNDWLVGPTGGD